jgi:uroporphyrinogen-III synthase
VKELEAAGLAAVALPLIDIVPDPDSEAMLGEAWRTLAGRDFVMFVSAAAVERFFARGALAPARAWPPGPRAGSTGPGTTAALRRAGVPAEAIDVPAADAPTFDSEALWAAIGTRDWAGRSALLVRGEGGRDWLADTLRAAGAGVDALHLYRRTCPQWTAAQWAACERAWSEPRRHWWHLSSSQAIDHLARLWQPHAAAVPWAALQALASHPRIAARAHEAGFGIVREVRPGIAAVVAALAGRPAGAG